MGESRVQIKVEPSGLKATARIVRGAPMAPDELRNAITVAGITTGLDDDSIRQLAELLEDPDGASRDTVIATGQPPRDGDDGRFALIVESHHVIGTARADGSLDFRTQNMVTNIRDRELVARYTPPTPGTPGKTVRGKPLAAQRGNDTLPELGAGVILEREAGEIYARRAGVLSFVPDQHLDVTDIFENDGDVDYTTGNLEVLGSVWVKGSICPDFAIAASANVIVEGQVTDGTVEAGADLTIVSATRVKSGRIRARGNVRIHHGTSAAIAAGATLSIGDHCLNCDLLATVIEAFDGRGLIVGGTACARERIEIQDAGSTGEVQTQLIAGFPTREHYALRQKRVAYHKQARSRTKRADRIRSGQRSKGGKAGREATSLSRELLVLERRFRQVEADLLRGATVIVHRVAHPGVRIKFGKITHDIVDAEKGVEFTYDPEEQRIRIERLNP